MINGKEQYIALVYDPATESDLVFFVQDHSPDKVRRRIKKFYKERDWSDDGIVIKVKALNMPEGQSIQMIGHRYVRGLKGLDEREKIAAMHKDG